ncbi:MAG: SLBB domain-containing protein [Chitinispirillales bacterium]|nr:SLBB domain-containing protein [Chitinispirillales bacterium]
MEPRHVRRATAVILALVLAVCAYGQSALTQPTEMTKRRMSLKGSESSTSTTMGFGVGASFDQLFAHPQSGMILPDDNSIDENEYLIGAGDVFFITVVESPSLKYTAAVDQNGKAYIQNVGLINVGKMSYAEAKKAISQYISSRLKNPSEIYVALVQTKNATVSFTGQISAPGSYELPGATRLLDALKTANGNELPLASDADLRRVQCLGSGDSAVFYDLLAYLYNGDAKQNPYVYPGDRIRISPTTDKVFISGAVRSPPPGYYPLKKGETIGEFLTMFTLDNTADLDAIIVYQPTENTKRIISSSKADYVLNDLDAITVPVKRNYSGIYTASIAGEIASPGHYPIVENSTTARQLIDMAGGVKASAFLDQAVVIRPLRTLPDRFNNGATQMGAVRPERGSAVAVASASRDYAVIRLILYNADNVLLEPQDQIIIPKKDNFVYISGSVRSPGAYLFIPGKDSRYYVTQAGGFSNNADRTNVQVFLKYGDAVQGIEPRCVEPGSVIIVPASVQNKFLTQVLLPIISTLATTIGVGLAIYNSR